MDIPDPMPGLEQLSSSLDQLEHVLEPLLEKPWNETLQGLDVLQRAKLNVLLAYVVHDLAWGAGKTPGPKTRQALTSISKLV